MKMVIVTSMDEMQEGNHLVSEEIYKEISLLIFARTYPEWEKGVTKLEITHDPSDNREIVLEIIKQLRGKDGKPASRATALAVTKLQEARFWLGEAMFGEGS